MNSQEVRLKILDLLAEALKAGARKVEACKVLDIDIRTLQRWESNVVDKRSVVKKIPHNILSKSEKEKIIETCCSERFRDSTPNEIVPLLAQEGKYIASESTFYRILRFNKLLKHRNDTRPKTKKSLWNLRQMDQIKFGVGI